MDAAPAGDRLSEHARANLYPLDEGFDSFLWSQQRVKFERIVACLEELGVGGTLADVGCSSGVFGARYRELPGIREVHGLDFNPESLARARDRGLVTHPWSMDEQDCPLPDGSMDAIVAADVIEHLVNTDRFVRELRRVLRPGGHLLVTTPNLAFWWSRVRLLRGRLPWLYPGASSSVRVDPNQALDHIRVQTLPAWRALFEHHGFEVRDVRGYPPSPPERPTLRDRVFLACDRLVGRRPSTSYGLLFVLRRPAGGGGGPLTPSAGRLG